MESTGGVRDYSLAMVDRRVPGHFDWVRSESSARHVDSVRALAKALQFRPVDWRSDDPIQDAPPEPAVSTFVWRGVADRGWPLHPGLYRRALRQHRAPRELDIKAIEHEIIYSARKAQYGTRKGRELTDLELLAVLQHHGAATRLLDVTRNTLVALWFATQPAVDANGRERDGALFGIDVTGRSLPRRRETWSIDGITRTPGLWHWEPPPLEERIRAQLGSFVFSRTTTVSGPSGDVLTSLDLQPRELDDLKEGLATRLAATVPAPRRRPLIVFIIPSSSKRAIRDELATFYGQDERTIYPDLPGFARAWSANA